MSTLKLAQLETIGVKMDDGEFKLSVTDAPVGVRKVVALSTTAPVCMTILTQDGLDLGYEIDEDADIAVRDLRIKEDEFKSGQDDQLFVRVELPHHCSRGVYITPETLEDLTDNLAKEKDMRDNINRCLLTALWGSDPIEGFPRWDKVFYYLEKQGANGLAERLKALKLKIDQA